MFLAHSDCKRRKDENYNKHIRIKSVKSTTTFKKILLTPNLTNTQSDTGLLKWSHRCEGIAG